MTAPLRRRRAAAADERPADTTAPAVPEGTTERPEMAGDGHCNVPGCDRTPEWRGLCPAHRQTHRGLADRKGRSGD